MLTQFERNQAGIYQVEIPVPPDIEYEQVKIKTIAVFKIKSIFPISFQQSKLKPFFGSLVGVARSNIHTITILRQQILACLSTNKHKLNKKILGGKD